MDIDTQSQDSENFPSAPPPPQEVKIRTMRSDLASMAQSGGGLPQFQNVKINIPVESPEQQNAPQDGRRVSFGIATVVIAVVIVLAIIGYVIFSSSRT